MASSEQSSLTGGFNPALEQDPNDEGPAFIDTSDAVEVKVDLENEPMEEDEMMTVEGKDGDARPCFKDMAQITVSPHIGPVYSVNSCRTDSALLILTGGGDDKAYVHVLKAGGRGKGFVHTSTQELTPPGHNHTDTISCVAFNDSSEVKTPSMLATGCYDGMIQLWDIKHENGETKACHVRQIEGPSDIEWISFHPSGGTVLLAGSTDGTVWMWFVASGKCLQVFVGHSNDVTAGGFTPDGKHAVTAGVDGTLRIWAPKKGICKHSFGSCGFDNCAGNAGEPFAVDPLTCLAMQAFEGGQQLALCGCVDGRAWLANLSSKRVLARLEHFVPTLNAAAAMKDEPRSVEAVGFASPALNVKWCATGGSDGFLKVWDMSNNQCRQQCLHSDHQGKAVGITKLRWHFILPLVYTAATDGNVRLWDARSGVLLSEFTGHEDVINDMSISFGAENTGQPDFVTTVSDDQTMKVFEVFPSQLLAAAVSSALA